MPNVAWRPIRSSSNPERSRGRRHPMAPPPGLTCGKPSAQRTRALLLRHDGSGLHAQRLPGVLCWGGSIDPPIFLASGYFCQGWRERFFPTTRPSRSSSADTPDSPACLFPTLVRLLRVSGGVSGGDLLAPRTREAPNIRKGPVFPEERCSVASEEGEAPRPQGTRDSLRRGTVIRSRFTHAAIHLNKRVTRRQGAPQATRLFPERRVTI